MWQEINSILDLKTQWHLQKLLSSKWNTTQKHYTAL